METAIVFGGSSGIGEATAKLLLGSGFRVIIAGRDRARLDAAKLRLGQLETASVNAIDRVAVNSFFAATGTFDHLILCHSGGRGAGPFKSLNLDDVRGGMEGKFFAQMSVAQAAVPTLAAAGSITFVSAGSARTAIPGTAGLAAINGAIEAMVPTLARELAPVRVNAVSPGVIDTPWWSAMPKEMREGAFAHTAASLPVKRVGQPEDVAEAIVLLVRNTFMTGTVIEVDGGARLAG